MKMTILLLTIAVSLMANILTDKEYEEKLDISIKESQKRLPMAVDEFTDLIKILKDNEKVEYQYNLKTNKSFFKNINKLGTKKEKEIMILEIKKQQKYAVVSNACASQFLSSILSRGREVVFSYDWIDMQIKSKVVVKKEDCQKKIILKDDENNEISEAQIKNWVKGLKEQSPMRINMYLTIDDITYKDNIITSKITINPDKMIEQVKILKENSLQPSKINEIIENFIKNIGEITKKQVCSDKRNVLLLKSGKFFSTNYFFEDGKSISLVKTSYSDCQKINNLK